MEPIITEEWRAFLTHRSDSYFKQTEQMMTFLKRWINLAKCETIIKSGKLPRASEVIALNKDDTSICVSCFRSQSDRLRVEPLNVKFSYVWGRIIYLYKHDSPPGLTPAFWYNKHMPALLVEGIDDKKTNPDMYVRAGLFHTFVNIMRLKMNEEVDVTDLAWAFNGSVMFRSALAYANGIIPIDLLDMGYSESYIRALLEWEAELLNKPWHEILPPSIIAAIQAQEIYSVITDLDLTSSTETPLVIEVLPDVD
jgi:hypothetical protein